ncbi:ABC-type glycerol-3-phosphate transport system substrate-binding protein [Paenibacillus shirakamiensis]|uniref:ABC-type glycerol-3-phosphate transport system substrate-binding protein n=1 Tax=Paenibacillus shirakamiensis TaxID=1265935 RepID=A0ABS4JFY3_9BACL|nr:extracellular solute-binding protein [Paenibacillus shirakamiensis]MBP2000631.1 ABC-type glycerol-3-phosphate transport system substrate-binding protein [Paenibacillus shirakamiensis]
MNTKPWAIGLITVMLGASLTACTTKKDTPSAQEVSSTPKDAKIELNFANWISTEDATKPAYEKLIAEFEKTHPKIKIKSVGIPFAQYKDQVLVSSKGGNAPDVLMSNQGFTPAFVGANVVSPLEKLISADILRDIVPASKNGVTFNGAVYALPWTPHPNALFWNKTLFQKAGLDPNTPPKTWQELLLDAQKITALKSNASGSPVYGLGEATKTGSYTGQMLYRLVLSNGGKLVDDQGTLVLGEGTALTDSLNYLRQLSVQKITPVGAEIKDLRGMFANGSLGFLIDGDFGRNNFRTMSGKGEAFDKEWGVTVVPVNKTGRSETVFTEHQLLIAKDSKHADAAAEFVSYLVSKDALTIYHQFNGVLSSLTSVSALPELNEDDYAKVFNEQMKTASAFPTANPKFDNAMKEASNLSVLATTTNEDIPSIIAKVLPKIQALYQK